MDRSLRKFFLSIFFLLFFITPFSLVDAQQRSERWVCLNAVHCWEEKPESEACIIKNGHRVLLTAEPDAKLLPNKETYIIECLATVTGQICTAGTTDLDMLVYGIDNTAALKASDDYLFEGLFAADGTTSINNPISSKEDGNIDPAYWQSYSKGNDRKFLALNYFEPIPDMGPGEEKTQQVGTFSFENAANQSDCISISWDPYGRVFDSQTLEPVNKTTVTLLKKRNDGSFTIVTPADLLGGSILNPQTTEEDGDFSFVVPDGIYKLTASQSNYVFPEQTVNLQSNYSKIYSDIYPDQTGEEIVQQGTFQHRDIPLKQVIVGLETSPKLMEYFYDLNKPTSTAIVTGRVSHPFAKIKAYSLKPNSVSQENVRYRLLPETVSADKLGHFVLEVDQSQFEPTESFGEITIQKIDLTQPSLVEKFKQWLLGFISKVNAQTTIASSIRLEPIFNHLEGYAYNAGGEVLPNATVSIYLSFSNKPSYQTKTDDKGYYQISSEFLPSMPYRITYTTTAGQIVKTSTSQFIAQNSDSIVASDIKINQFTNKEGKVITPPLPEKAPGIADSERDSSQNLPVNKSSKFLSTSLPLILTIIVLFLLLVVTVAVVLMKKEKSGN
ncbi:MAG: hypothetical protein UR89_C0033G0006 [Candidatus Roizmanbacteria bacterium GW2011_GWA2_35_8]|uniref:Carboxypeptidase regulatory-like domain-containing protein n=1 Tax=Candidatus Roizmanbacteria bacterium GW2011_GWA2_35_8 TaxID=1618479 RepID=A0A0G0CYK1_9BACT|nr:MAG: hypothetical protein UR89_C0033G0006 [Candidatus Roizmanbacteria bacterium GW2011_GWA2_35_8]